MAEIKTFWEDPGMPMSTDLSGDTIVESGSDANADGGDEHGNACKPLWSDAPVPYFSKAESSNSVSGLPALPNRFEPNQKPDDPPDLKERNPGTIDKS